VNPLIAMLYRAFGLRTLFTVVAIALALVVASPATAEAKASRVTKKASKKKRSKKARRATRRGKASAKRRRKRRRGRFSGHAAGKATLRTEELPKPSGDIWLYAPNFREELKVHIYDEGGRLDDAALAELDHGFRCKRTGEERASDPRLAEILSIIYDHFGGKRIELVSAFRFQRNEGSRHYHASAMDIRIPGVSTRELYSFAESLDTGGMGIGLYPRSGFVHIDFRAPGDPSYRWTDTSPPGSGTKGGEPSRKWKRREPGS